MLVYLSSINYINFENQGCPRWSGIERFDPTTLAPNKNKRKKMSSSERR
jgi:hypothetical protein